MFGSATGTPAPDSKLTHGDHGVACFRIRDHSKQPAKLEPEAAHGLRYMLSESNNENRAAGVEEHPDGHHRDEVDVGGISCRTQSADLELNDTPTCHPDANQSWMCDAKRVSPCLTEWRNPGDQKMVPRMRLLDHRCDQMVPAWRMAEVEEAGGNHLASGKIRGWDIRGDIDRRNMSPRPSG